MAPSKRIFKVTKPVKLGGATFDNRDAASAAKKAGTRYFSKNSKKKTGSVVVHLVDKTKGARTENKTYKYRVTRKRLTSKELDSIPSLIGFVPEYKTSAKAIKS